MSDSWHVCGDSSYDDTQPCALTRIPVFDHLVQTLPMRDFNSLPLMIDSTGYIVRKRDKLEGRAPMPTDLGDYQTCDPHGRHIFVIGDVLYWQRKTNIKTVVMHGKINDPNGYAKEITEDIWSELFKLIPFDDSVTYSDLISGLDQTE
jgi:hypothetical protein